MTATMLKLGSFTEERAALAALCGRTVIERDWSRLEEIYEFAEGCWWEYARKLTNGPVRYVAIGEAPPWIPTGSPQYVLDPDSRGILCNPYISAFRLALRCPETYSAQQALDHLAMNGFLWIDSIPFAVGFQPTDRKRGKYEALIRLTVQNYLMRKIDASGLRFAGDAKIAFVVKRNAEAIFRNFRRLSVGRCEFDLSDELIAVNKSWHPDAERMREIFGLEI